MSARGNMQKPLRLSRSLGGQVSRRQFLGRTAAAAAFSIVPRRVLGGPGYVAPSDKINTAFTGLVPRGWRGWLHSLREPEGQVAAVCDPTRARQTTRSGTR